MKNIAITQKIWKQLKNIENIARGTGRLVGVGENPTLPEPEHEPAPNSVQYPAWPPSFTTDA